MLDSISWSHLVMAIMSWMLDGVWPSRRVTLPTWQSSFGRQSSHIARSRGDMRHPQADPGQARSMWEHVDPTLTRFRRGGARRSLLRMKRGSSVGKTGFPSSVYGFPSWRRGKSLFGLRSPAFTDLETLPPLLTRRASNHTDAYVRRSGPQGHAPGHHCPGVGPTRPWLRGPQSRCSRGTAGYG